MEQAENAMKLEKDPVKKELLRDAIRELREASQAVLQAAKAYRQNPNDPNLKAKVMYIEYLCSSHFSSRKNTPDWKGQSREL